MVRVCVRNAPVTRICEFSLISVLRTKAAPLVHSHARKYIVRHTARNQLSILPRALTVGGSMARHGALKTQVQHFVGENVAWEKVTTN